MTVGEALAEARNQAGLSVDELSERTRIRGTIIRSIEQDDYAACGGDLYVRGYVRALAGAVGIDAQPLIRGYDEGRSSAGAAAATFDPAPVIAAPAEATRFDLAPVAGDDSPTVSEDPAATAFDLPPITDDMLFPPPADAVPGPGPAAPVAASLAPPAARPPGSEDTRFDLPPVTDDLMAAGYDLRPGPRPPAAGAGATSFLPVLGADPAGPPPAGTRPPAGRGNGDKSRRLLIGAVVVVLVLAAGGFLGLRLSGGGTASQNTAATSPASPGASAPASAGTSSAGAAARASAAAASAAASASASAAASKPPSPPVSTLAVASAVAFGPDGTGDGDNPAGAGDALGGAGQHWSTQWYATPQFGMLKRGTGLLLNLGRSDTVTRVRIDLSPYRGAKLQLRAGGSAQDVRTVATAADAGGTVRLNLPHPVTARYLLIWFTVLPPDGAGHYAETVSRVVVSGHR